MTDEEKEKYRGGLIATCKTYCHIDYDDDIKILELMLDTTMDEMTELIPNFDRNNLTSRQKLLAFMSVKELYNKEFTMPKMSIDTYTEYLELAEVIDAKQRYSKQDIEAMGLFICKAYGDQFTVEELKNPETGLDAAGLILEFQFIDMGIADELTKRMENIEKNFQSGK